MGTDRLTDVMELIGSYRDYAELPKSRTRNLSYMNFSKYKIQILGSDIRCLHHPPHSATALVRLDLTIEVSR